RHLSDPTGWPNTSTLEDKEIDHFGNVLRGALCGVGAQLGDAGAEFLVGEPGEKRVGTQGKLVAETLPISCQRVCDELVRAACETGGLKSCAHQLVTHTLATDWQRFSD